MNCYQSWCLTRLNSRSSPLFDYIKDITEAVYSHIRLFADNTSPYLIVVDPFVAATHFNSDLSKIRMWAERWLVKFNPAKSKVITISYFVKCNIYFVLYIISFILPFNKLLCQVCKWSCTSINVFGTPNNLSCGTYGLSGEMYFVIISCQFHIRCCREFFI